MMAYQDQSLDLWAVRGAVAKYLALQDLVDKGHGGAVEAAAAVVAALLEAQAARVDLEVQVLYTYVGGNQWH